MLAAGGRSRYIHLWSLDTRRLLRIIEMPTKVTTVKQLEFLPDSFQDGFDQVCCLSLLKRNGLCSVILLIGGWGWGGQSVHALWHSSLPKLSSHSL